MNKQKMKIVRIFIGSKILYIAYYLKQLGTWVFPEEWQVQEIMKREFKL